MAGVLSDAGPLIALAGVEALGLLRNLFSEVQIPRAVFEECSAKAGLDRERIEAAVNEGWIKVTAASPSDGAPPCLGPGEWEAIRLARTMQNSLLIVDDRLARYEAQRLDLSFIGTARVLWIAEQRGLIRIAEEVPGHMAANGYRISPSLLEKIKSETAAADSGSSS
jgi:predicted nucleic acid-binding protein